MATAQGRHEPRRLEDTATGTSGGCGSADTCVSSVDFRPQDGQSSFCCLEPPRFCGSEPRDTDTWGQPSLCPRASPHVHAHVSEASPQLPGYLKPGRPRGPGLQSRGRTDLTPRAWSQAPVGTSRMSLMQSWQQPPPRARFQHPTGIRGMGVPRPPLPAPRWQAGHPTVTRSLTEGVPAGSWPPPPPGLHVSLSHLHSAPPHAATREVKGTAGAFQKTLKHVLL